MNKKYARRKEHTKCTSNISKQNKSSAFSVCMCIKTINSCLFDHSKAFVRQNMLWNIESNVGKMNFRCRNWFSLKQKMHCNIHHTFIPIAKRTLIVLHLVQCRTHNTDAVIQHHIEWIKRKTPTASTTKIMIKWWFCPHFHPLQIR